MGRLVPWGVPATAGGDLVTVTAMLVVVIVERVGTIVRMGADEEVVMVLRFGADVDVVSRVQDLGREADQRDRGQRAGEDPGSVSIVSGVRHRRLRSGHSPVSRFLSRRLGLGSDFQGDRDATMRIRPFPGHPASSPRFGSSAADLEHDEGVLGSSDRYSDDRGPISRETETLYEKPSVAGSSGVAPSRRAVSR